MNLKKRRIIGDQMREQAGILDALDKLIKRKNDEGAKYLDDQEFN